VTILNYEGLKWFYKMVQEKTFKLKKFFTIWDESSMFKDHTTKRWEIMADAYPIYSPYRVCLSGTPMPNVMTDLWAQYFLLDSGERLQSDFYQFRSRYFNYSGAPRYTTTLKHGAEDRIYDKIADITDRLGPDDHIELPEVVHNDIYLDLTPKLRKMYEELEHEFLLELDEGDVVANSSAVLGSKLRQFNQGALYLEREEGVPRGTPKEFELVHDIKVKAVKALMDTAAGSPILAPIQFRFEKVMIDKVMRYDVPIINGSTSANDAKRLVREWNEGIIPLLLVHPRSVAFSLNLQFGGHTVLWVALPWEMDLYEQLIRRLRRRGQVNTVTVHRLIFKNTIDVVVAEALKRKNLNQERLFEGVKERRNGKR
jgi:SNF2 family DNA or RNA helicase